MVRNRIVPSILKINVFVCCTAVALRKKYNVKRHFQSVFTNPVVKSKYATIASFKISITYLWSFLTNVRYYVSNTKLAVVRKHH